MSALDHSLPSLTDDPTLRAYRAAVRDWHGYMRFLGFASIQDNEDVPIDNLFVPPELAESAISPDAEPSSWAKRTAFLDCLEPGRPLVVLGDPGSGKSTLVNWLTWRLAAGLTRPIGRGLDGCLPVPMILREMHLGELNTFDDLLNAFLARPVADAFKKDASLIREFAAVGKVLFLLDGIDELSRQASLRLRKVLSDLPSEFSGCFCLLTSRIVGYEEFMNENVSLSKPEIAAISAIAANASSEVVAGMPTGAWAHASGALLPGWMFPFLGGSYREPLHMTRYVAPFDDRRIEEFANAWYQLRDNAKTRAEATAKDFLAAIHRDVGITRLARTPNLLTLMALVFRVKAQLPDGRGMLYDDISQAYLESIDRARGGIGAFRANDDGRESNEPPWREKKRWLARVGFEMQLRRASKSDRVLRAFEHSTRELLFSTTEVRGWIATAMGTSGYGGGQDEAQAFLEWAARRSGLLVPRGEGLHAFMHLSFQEYFAAAFIVEELKSPEWSSASESGEALRANGLHPEVTRENLLAWAGKVVWEEVLILAFEQLAHEPRWAERLLKLVLPSKLPEISGALAARLLLNPHSGLPQTTRGLLRAAVHVSIADRQRSPFSIGRETEGALERIWRDPVERNMWLTAFASLTPTRLNLQNCALDDLDFLVHFPKLNDLSISSPGSERLDAIAGLREIYSLSITGAKNPNFTPLASLAKLVDLGLDECQLEDLTALNAFQSLSQVRFFDCVIMTMDVALLNRAAPIKLSFLNCGAGRVVNTQPSRVAVASISFVNYRRRQGSGTLPAESFYKAILEETDTEEFYPSNDPRLPPAGWVPLLAQHTRLKRLKLGYERWASLELVRKLPQLRKLHIEDAVIENFDALEGLTELEVWASEDAKPKVSFRSGRGPKMHYR